MTVSPCDEKVDVGGGCGSEALDRHENCEPMRTGAELRIGRRDETTIKQNLANSQRCTLDRMERSEAKNTAQNEANKQIAALRQCAGQCGQQKSGCALIQLRFNCQGIERV